MEQTLTSALNFLPTVMLPDILMLLALSLALVFCLIMLVSTRRSLSAVNQELSRRKERMARLGDIRL